MQKFKKSENQKLEKSNKKKTDFLQNTKISPRKQISFLCTSLNLFCQLFSPGYPGSDILPILNLMHKTPFEHDTRL